MNSHTMSSAGASGNRAVPYLVIALLAAFLGALNSRGAVPALGIPASVALLGGVAWGLLWTGLAAVIAARIRRAGAQPVHSPGAAALLPALACTMVFGVGLIQHLMFPSPDAYLAMQQSAAADGSLAFYIACNGLSEWVLVPLAVFLNWPSPRPRTIALIAAVVFYAERLVTYLYFAPTVVSWKDQPRTPQLLDQASVWLPLDWSRMLLNAAVIVLFSLVIFFPASRRLPAAWDQTSKPPAQPRIA